MANKCALPEATAYETPVGTLRVDAESVFHLKHSTALFRFALFLVCRWCCFLLRSH
jgi:hypothetical protein